MADRTILVAVSLIAAFGTASASADSRRLRMIDDTGLGDPQTAGIARMVAHDDWFFLATWNVHTGTVVYRSRDGESWEPISEPGIHGGANDFTVASFVWFHGRLYAGTWNQREGGAMYRANADAPDPADIKWETVGTGGLGNKLNWGFTHTDVFKDQLYAGCFNFVEGSELFRSATGDPGTWEMVIPKGWNATWNTDSTMTLVHDGYLYVGTESARDKQYVEGTQLWRTDGNIAPPYDQWQQVNPNGYGNPRNHNTCGLAALNGKIYAGTWNETQGFEIWRATPSKDLPYDWERVVTNGFDDPEDIFLTWMTTLDDTLFAGSIGRVETEPPLYFLPNAKLKYAHGGKLLKSTDGKTWESIDAPGFLDPPQVGVQTLAVFKGKLYIGCQAFDVPSQLWVYEPVNE